MPLMRVDLPRGHSCEEIRRILDIGYEVAREAFQIPKGDRYQIVTQHDPDEMVMEDTGLGFQRSQNVIVFSLASTPRTTEQKLLFYRRLSERLCSEAGFQANDILINITGNTREDWSFAGGRAQFLTGELK